MGCDIIGMKIGGGEPSSGGYGVVWCIEKTEGVGMMKIYDLRVLTIIGMAVCIFVSSASANLLTATSTAVEVETGVWKYTIDMQWDFSDDGFQNGLSHWDIDVCFPLKDDTTEVIDDIWFEDVEYPYLSGIDGTSTPDGEGAPDDVLWFASIDTLNNTIKYEQPMLVDPAHTDPVVLTEPGVSGEGTFWFYSTIAPVDDVTDFGILGAKADTASFEGTLSGDWVCVPEPATLMLLTLGSLMVARKRR